MKRMPALGRSIAASLAVAAMAVMASPSAWADKKATIGPVTFDVPDDFATVAGPPAYLREDATGITVEVSELPPQAFQEFKGDQFLEFLKSLGYANPAYAEGALKRTDTHTYVLADAKGAQGPESRFLLVLGGSGRAAIITAYAPKSQIDSGKASRGAIETILTSAVLAPGAAAVP